MVELYPVPSEEVLGPAARRKRKYHVDNRRLRSRVRQPAFLAAFAETGSVTLAARSANLSKDMHYRWLKTDPEYAGKFEVARMRAVQMLEDEALRRAREGWLEPVFYAGKVCGYVPRYSDSLLMFLLRGWRPDRYRDRTEICGPGGGSVVIDQRVVTLAELLTIDELRDLCARIEVHSGWD